MVFRLRKYGEEVVNASDTLHRKKVMDPHVSEHMDRAHTITTASHYQTPFVQPPIDNPIIASAGRNPENKSNNKPY